MTTTQATLDGWDLIGTTGGGGKSRLLELEGWLKRTPHRERGNRTVLPGAWSTSGLDSSRQVTLKGQTVYTSAATAAAERRQMLGLVALGQAVLTVTDAAGPLQGTVELDDAEVHVVNHLIVTWSFEVTITSAYLVTPTPVVVNIPAGATADFINPGTVAAEMEVRTTGSGTLNLIAYGATQSTGATTVPSGSIFTSGDGFTNPARTAIGPAGENLYNSLIPDNHWLAIVKGANSIQNTGTAPVQVTYYPLWA